MLKYFYYICFQIYLFSFFYLKNQSHVLGEGVDMSIVYEENASYDTIGNAYMARVMHTEVSK